MQKQLFFSFIRVIDNTSENYIYPKQTQRNIKKVKQAEKKKEEKRKKINAFNHKFNLVSSMPKITLF